MRLTLQWKRMHGVCGNHCKIVKKEYPHTLTSGHTLLFYHDCSLSLVEIYKSQSENQDKITVFEMLKCRFKSPAR